jgi:GH24 family phage-related lysozyme (muramidase)
MSDYSRVVTDLCNSLRDEEGEISWLYLDTSGIVTIGRGHALRTADDCAALPWKTRYDAALLRREYGAVLQASPTDRGMLLHYSAHHYAGLTTARLNADEISAILFADIHNFIQQVEHIVPDFAKYPAGPQQAVLDMCFNLGTHGFAHGFPHCYECVRNRDFKGAAASCHRRPPISDARNARTAALFQNS